MSTTAKMRKRVQRGAAFLDERQGPDWHKTVHLERLNVADPQCCVLGQLLNEYRRGMQALRINPQESCSYGFHIDGDGNYYKGANYQRNWHILTRYWIQLIAERLHKDERQAIQAS